LTKTTSQKINLTLFYLFSFKNDTESNLIAIFAVQKYTLIKNVKK